MSTWALISLTEVISGVSRPDSEMDMNEAVRRVAETLDAEAAVLCGPLGLQSAIGFGPAENCPTEQVWELASTAATEGEIDGLGHAYIASAEVEGIGLMAVFARTTDPFSIDEMAFVRSVGKVIGLAAQMRVALRAERTALDRERHRSRHDGLTGLPNRTSIENKLMQLTRDPLDEPLTVLFVDLDNFKLANDTLGHAFGDQVLKTVSERLRKVVRDSDTVGRLSGDEFVAICPGMPVDAALRLAERIQEHIRQPIYRGEQGHVITASVGIAEYAQNDDAEQLVGNADLAMYRAKQQGRSRIEVFDADLRERLERKVIMGQELRRAIRAQEFVVHTQPILSLPEREVVATEALVRWEHPTRGMVPPNDFIPDAEETGLIAAIDRLVIKQVVELLAASPEWPTTAVNLSAKTFADHTLPTWLATLLARHQLDPTRLIIEITETALIDHIEAAATQLRALRSLGLSVMIDDFGTGYSSLSHLQLLDVDGVKIDRSFTASLGADVRSSAIVMAVMHMADAMDLTVVAEGVETEGQVDSLLDLLSRTGHVELKGQGYLFGRPAPLDDATSHATVSSIVDAGATDAAEAA